MQRELDASSLAEYLRQSGRIAANDIVQVSPLPGGVSNAVFLVTREGKGAGEWVVKQARRKLQVVDDWQCSVDRIWREVDVLRAYSAALVDNVSINGIRLRLPRIIFEDREERLYGMSAAPLPRTTLKAGLLAGTVATVWAVAAGTFLAQLHGMTWSNQALATRFADRQFFDALRLDPYYRHVAQRQADVAAALDNLIEESARFPLALVHGDFSPKNLLVGDVVGDQEQPQLTLIDFEVGHFGDPAFDWGFFFTHLVLKSLRPGQQQYAQQWMTAAATAYRHTLQPLIGDVAWHDLQRRALRHLGGCLLARVDGKSKVDYLAELPQDEIRRLGRDLLQGFSEDKTVAPLLAPS